MNLQWEGRVPFVDVEGVSGGLEKGEVLLDV